MVQITMFGITNILPALLIIMASTSYARENRNSSLEFQPYKKMYFSSSTFISTNDISVYCRPGFLRNSYKNIPLFRLLTPSCNTYIPGDLCKQHRSFHDHKITVFCDTITQAVGMNLISCGTMTPFSNTTHLVFSNRRVRRLDLSGIGLTYLPSGIFRHYRSLKYLNLSRNFISRYDPHDYLDMQNLQILDMSYNNITEVGLNVFTHNTKIQILILASNSISTIGKLEPVNQTLLIDLSQPVNETMYSMIDLSSNKFTCVDEPLYSLLRTNITINIDGNPFTCECMQSIRQGNFDNCTCKNSSQLHPLGVLVETDRSLFMHFKLQILLGVAFLAGFIIAFIYMFRKRMSLCRCVRYPLDLAELVIQKPEVVQYENHAYIVCHDDDHAILRKIMSELADKRQMKIVCDARDAHQGDFKIASIEKFLSTSRRIVFVMSSKFLNSKMCLYVLNLAASMEYLEQKCVIISLKVRPFTREQEKLLEKLTSGKIWYEYPNDDEHNESFWNVLANAINDPKLHVQILGIRQW